MKVMSKVLKTLKNDAPLIKLIFGNAMIGAGTVILFQSANDISKVNDDLKVKKGLSKIKDGAIGYTKAGGAGVACITIGTILGDSSYADLGKQITNLSAALALTTTSFNQYRKRVRDDIGAEKDYEYMTGDISKTSVKVSPDGKSVITEKEVVSLKDGSSKVVPNSFMFDETHDDYVPGDIEHSSNFLFGAINNINMVLHSRESGQMTTNEMFEICHVEPTIAGQSAGAFARTKDGYMQNVRFNPEGMKRLINGDDSAALCIIEYADGRPLETDIFNDSRNSWKLI